MDRSCFCSQSFYLALDTRLSSFSGGQLRQRSLSETGKTLTEVVNDLGAESGYIADITLGTLPQTLRLLIDTASTDVW